MRKNTKRESVCEKRREEKEASIAGSHCHPVMSARCLVSRLKAKRVVAWTLFALESTDHPRSSCSAMDQPWERSLSLHTHSLCGARRLKVDFWMCACGSHKRETKKGCPGVSYHIFIHQFPFTNRLEPTTHGISFLPSIHPSISPSNIPDLHLHKHTTCPFSMYMSPARTTRQSCACPRP